MSWKNVQYENGKMRTSEGGGGGGSSTFAGLDDVNFSNLQNGQVPKYNSTTQKWENADESGGGGTVTDVEVDGVSVVNPQGVAEITTPDAYAIDYDNQQSGLQATNMQDAIDELAQGSGSGGVEDVEVNGTSVVNAQNVAEIKSYKEVTQAEYQALPSSKLTDNILYCIKDSAGADGFPPLIYSDEERVVGVWRDGKPLYQKTINVDFVNGRRDYQHGIQNVDMIFFDDSATFIYAKDKSEFNHFYNAGYNDSAQFVEGYGRFLQQVTRSIVILKANPNVGSNYSAIITLRYTKTTDTPGSGTWTTQGTLAHHYSTTEQVIGTWIDGKPLYEKSFQFSNYIAIPTKSWTTIMDVSSLNISKLIHCDFIDMEGVYWSGALNRISSGNLQSYAFEGWPVKEVTLKYTKTTDV